MNDNYFFKQKLPSVKKVVIFKYSLGQGQARGIWTYHSIIGLDHSGPLGYLSLYPVTGRLYPALQNEGK